MSEDVNRSETPDIKESFLHHDGTPAGLWYRWPNGIYEDQLEVIELRHVLRSEQVGANSAILRMVRTKKEPWYVAVVPFQTDDPPGTERMGISLTSTMIRALVVEFLLMAEKMDRDWYEHGRSDDEPNKEDGE